MIAAPDPLAQAIDVISREAPADVFLGVLSILDHAPKDNAGTLRWSLERIAAGPNLRAPLQRLIDAWQERAELSAGAIALALRAARLGVESQRDEVEVVWTGPVSAVVPARRTDQVLLSLIEGATRELLIVSFAVHEGERWIAALRGAISRGVRVTFVVETRASGKVSVEGLRAIDPELRSRLTVLTWDLAKRPMDASGKTGTLHAKCAVADRRRAFISSANLTEHAMTLNMEMGILIGDGPLPARISALFEDLAAADHLVQIRS